MEVPAEWSQTDTTPQELDDGVLAPRVTAAPDLAAQTATALLVALPDDGADFTLALLVQAASEEDLDEVPRILQSFRAS